MALGNTKNRTPLLDRRAVIFIIGCLFGLLMFLACFGYRVLDVTYDDWLMMGDYDLSQHYTGWMHFRTDPWNFPIGLIDSLSIPYKVSIIYTDSIPIFAVIFKLFRDILPETFQYFGLYGLLCYMLQGGVSALLISGFTKRHCVSLLGSILFLLCFPLLHRMFYHTALASHYIILLALYLWFKEYRGSDGKITAKKCILWALMGVLCVSVHSYYLPMVGIILVASITDEAIKRDKERKKVLLFGLLTIVSFCLAALLALYVLGGFWGDSAGIGVGIGSFTANLNTFFNSLGYGLFRMAFPLYYEYQYEGFAYLGMGMIMLLILCLCLWASSAILLYACTGKSSKVRYYRTHIIREYATNHPTRFSAILLFLFMWMFATLPMVCANNRKIFGVPLPGFIEKAWNIFRSNGRFIWVPMYILMLAMLVFIDKHAGDKVIVVLLSTAILIQIADISGFAWQKHSFFMKERKYDCLWEDEDLKELVEDKKRFLFMYTDYDYVIDSAFYGYFHDMSQNSFYFARDIDDEVLHTVEDIYSRLEDGDIFSDSVYIFKEEDYDKKLFKGHDIKEVVKDGFVIVSL